MKFCEDCGSYMRRTTEGLYCKKCNKLIQSRLRVPSEVEVEGSTPKKDDPEGIYVLEGHPKGDAGTTRKCPHCGSFEAQRWFSHVSGEHAGVRRERTIEHFKCIKCSHSWSIST